MKQEAFDDLTTDGSEMAAAGYVARTFSKFCRGHQDTPITVGLADEIALIMKGGTADE
jgi:hypothetical protein